MGLTVVGVDARECGDRESRGSSFMRMIRFQFEADVAVQATAFLLDRLGGSVDKVKLMKLLYLADKEHFLKYGRPITGDSQWALPHGPVPSCTLNLLNGADDEFGSSVTAYVGTSDTQYKLRSKPNADRLTNTDVTVLESVLDQFGQMHTWALVDFTHRLPEYVECHIPRSSSQIPYEVILKYHGTTGGLQRFDQGRPVIWPDMASKMLCPFAASEPDL